MVVFIIFVFISKCKKYYFYIFTEMSRDFFNKKNYLQASRYGSYAKGTAMGGIIATLILISLIVAQVIHYQVKYNY